MGHIDIVMVPDRGIMCYCKLLYEPRPIWLDIICMGSHFSIASMSILRLFVVVGRIDVSFTNLLRLIWCCISHEIANLSSLLGILDQGTLFRLILVVLQQNQFWVTTVLILCPIADYCFIGLCRVGGLFLRPLRIAWFIWVPLGHQLTGDQHVKYVASQITLETCCWLPSTPTRNWA